MTENQKRTDAELKKELRRKPREAGLGYSAISEMAPVSPFRSAPPAPRASPVEEPAAGWGEIEKLAPEIQRRVQNLMDRKTFSKLYSTAMGLPSRIRRLVKKVWKLEDNGKNWVDIADAVSAEASKILCHRMDVVMFAGVAFRRDTPDESKITKMVGAITEADALMMVYAHYLIAGASAKLSAHCVLLLRDEKMSHLIGGLADVLDFGSISQQRRAQRRRDAIADAEAVGWKLPERGGAK